MQDLIRFIILPFSKRDHCCKVFDSPGWVKLVRCSVCTNTIVQSKDVCNVNECIYIFLDYYSRTCEHMLKNLPTIPGFVFSFTQDYSMNQERPLVFTLGYNIFRWNICSVPLR